MSRGNLMRAGGIAMMLAGILRGIASFTPTTAADAPRILYLVIDSLLLVSIITLYAYLRRAPRWLSLPGFLLALVGAVLLVGHDVVDALGNLYAVAALLFAIGITLLALGSWVARALPRWTAFLIIASTVVGSLGYFVSGAGFLFVLSGVLFGLGLVGIGLNIWRKPSAPAAARP